MLMQHRFNALALVSLLLTSLFLVAMAGPAPTASAAPPIPLRWFYFVNGKSNTALQANYQNIDVISPDFYRLQSDGTIRGSNKPDVTNFAHSKGIKVVPMIQNDPAKDDFNKLLSDPPTFKNILDTIEKQVVDNGYDGYQVDFENLTSDSETLLTSFMAELSNRLRPKGKMVTMAVVSRTTSAVTTQFSAAYNYAALAPYLDLVTIMTYDYSYSGGAPGPIAPVTWQEKVLNYAVPIFGAGKVLLGVPFYGYDWNITQREKSPTTYRANSRSFDETMQLGQTNNGTFGFDNASKTPYLNYISNDEIHQVWFENAQSIQAKFDLMKKQQIRGFAVWRLGFEGQEFWPVIKNLVVPTKPVAKPGPDTSYRVYFAQTGHTLSNVFKRYWDKYGGLAQFGYPWTEEFQEVNPSDGKTYTVQYFERNRFEYHPEYAGTQYEVLLGLLGRQVTAGRESEAPFQRVTPGIIPAKLPGGNLLSIKSLLNAVDTSNFNYYPETGHTLSGPFKTYWEKNGGLAMFGYPITEEFPELNPADGKTYTVQYFERNRFEYHPEFAGTRFEVLMGLLGNQIMAGKGWL
jgi:spore germination protein YaaH